MVIAQTAHSCGLRSIEAYEKCMLSHGAAEPVETEKQLKHSHSSRGGPMSACVNAAQVTVAAAKHVLCGGKSFSLIFVGVPHTEHAAKHISYMQIVYHLFGG